MEAWLSVPQEGGKAKIAEVQTQPLEVLWIYSPSNPWMETSPIMTLGRVYL